MAHCDLRTKWMMYVSFDTNIQGDYVQTHGETHGLLIDVTNIYIGKPRFYRQTCSVIVTLSYDWSQCLLIAECWDFHEIVEQSKDAYQSGFVCRIAKKRNSRLH